MNESDIEVGKSIARASTAAEFFLLDLPKTGKKELDELISSVAKTAYLAGRNGLALEIMKVL